MVSWGFYLALYVVLLADQGSISAQQKENDSYRSVDEITDREGT